LLITENVQFKTVASHQYLEPGTFKYIYLYHHRTQAKQLWGLFIPGQKRAAVFVVDTVRSNQLPSLPALYNSERAAFMAKPDRTAAIVPEADHTFEATAETDVKKVHRQIGRLLAAYMQVSSPLDSCCFGWRTVFSKTVLQHIYFLN
jgi:DNA polymerase epsilon subunit 1